MIINNKLKILIIIIINNKLKIIIILNLARELKKMWNMKVTIVPIVIGAFGIITKGLSKGLEDLEVGRRVETIIGLYTPIDYFGWYATCSHKDGGRSIFSLGETIGQEDHVTCLKLGPRVNSSPAFLSHLQDTYFL